jgi:hypothetical protein
MRKTLSLTAALCLVAAVAVAEEAKKKPLSPASKAEATLAGKKLTVDYSAPSKRNRVIMGELVPYGKVWRTGANAATTFKTETDVMLGNLAVPAGTYTLFTIPGEKEWTVIVNRQTGQWGTNYDETQDLGRVKVPVTATKAPVETFNIGLQSSSAKAAALTMAWENASISVPVTVR